MASSQTEIVLTSSPDRPITAHDPVSGAVLAQFFGTGIPRGGLTVAGNALIAASHVSPTTAGSVRLYNWWSSAATHRVPTPEPVAPLVATPDGSHLFAGGLSGRIHVFSLPSGDLRCSFFAHGRAVSCLAVNGDGSLLLSGGDDGTVAVFPILSLLDVACMQDKDEDSWNHLALYQFKAHNSPVTCIASGTGGCNPAVVSSSLDGTCKLWSIANGSKLRTITFPCAMWCVTMDSTSYNLYAGGSDGKLYVVPLKARGGRLKEKGGHEMVAWGAEHCGAVTSLAMLDGDRKAVSASEDGIVRIWDVKNGLLDQAFASGGGDLVVARWVGRVIRGGESGNGAGFSEREMGRKVSEMMKMDEWLHATREDRRRAIEMLETTLDTYRRMLLLLIREAEAKEIE
ncbi:protein ROOT INITIATION DEFECTIVE 3-like [Typha angustifolia]|uniref:protein ROOT INITIATION DEFECTIVE 3-like n=1 Tax=Typha angustifolia TaxID=59011 RepID=UPI003C2C798F